jgi:hypothetical protein
MQNLAKHVSPLSSWPWQGTFCSQEEIEEKIEYEGIGVKLAFETKCFHKWTRVYNTCKYKTPNLIKIIVEHHHFFV